MTPENEQSAYDELAAWTLSLSGEAFLHQHVVDAWAAQHATAKSKPINVAFALLGLYLHLEKGSSGREVQRAHMQLAQPKGRGPGRKEWPRFPLPEARGTITVHDVIAAPEKERPQAIDCWCWSVWEAWQDCHGTVAAWEQRDLRESPKAAGRTVGQTGTGKKISRRK